MSANNNCSTFSLNLAVFSPVNWKTIRTTAAEVLLTFNLRTRSMLMQLLKNWMVLNSTARTSKLLNTKRRNKELIELLSSIICLFSTFLLEPMTINLKASLKNLENLSPFKSKEMKVKVLKIMVMSASKSLKMQKKLKKWWTKSPLLITNSLLWINTSVRKIMSWAHQARLLPFLRTSLRPSTQMFMLNIFQLTSLRKKLKRLSLKLEISFQWDLPNVLGKSVVKMWPFISMPISCMRRLRNLKPQLRSLITLTGLVPNP